MMEKLNSNEYPLVRQEENKKTILLGYPTYSPDEDIYNQEKEETDMDPENLIKKKDITSDELDVPGSELDDTQEAIGSEDEENNYYSLGGDGNDRLEEDYTDDFGIR